MSTYPSFASCLDLLVLTYSTGFSPFPTKNITECRGVGLERKTPPQGYICHKCKVPGHFIQHCPTNGDPNYDIKRVKLPTCIPKSMLMATPEGSYALPSRAVAVLRPNEAAFEKEIEGMPTTRSISDLPPELRCPLCKKVMNDVVLTGKCCFKSFCDKWSGWSRLPPLLGLRPSRPAFKRKTKRWQKKIEAEKEEIRTLEAKMQAQLQAQAKRFMGAMRMPPSAFRWFIFSRPHR
ncbi:hypothetical protein H6P81_012730 [Aristolochia fimbriata]|uniref:Zinc knuckle CX2CX3GHX4C domain-containing protein n=1 Tax=Aristolochia fimbriata TaxID=158543 RepID=A0AAV7ECM9_ARIFI|nr:hypothetical protein H6P81_012730 [Aristolochia fimbriata]